MVSERLAPLRAALSGRYCLERELGAGGMATVYLAHDLKHDRDVALKVLRPELAATLGAERFLREIRIAAQLQHPNILPVHDSGEAAGFLYYVMPFVEGHSLRERLAKEGELPVPEAARILRDVADALATAHAKGVVHRDIKPENVLLTGRHALVADFGVAKAVSEATGRQTLTTAGVALGTPTYMAPEQAAASPHIDQRADLYAFGVMAYEMLTGQPPFTAPTPQALLSAHVTEAPVEVTQRRATIPASLAQLIMRCLAKKAADRPQTADDLLPVLESCTTPSGGITPTETRPVRAVTLRRRLVVPVALGAVVVLAAAGYALWRSRAGVAPGADVREPVLVLPFEERVSSPELRGVGLQLADRIETGIAAATLGSVLQRRTVTGLGEDRVTAEVVRRVARSSGAATLITGAITQRRDSLEVTSQVLRARDFRTLFGLPSVRGAVSGSGQVMETAMQRALGAVGYYTSAAFRYYDVTRFTPPRSVEQLRLTARALQLYNGGDSRGALALYAEVQRRDTAAYWAGLGSFSALRNLGRPREADSVIRWLEARRNQLAVGEAGWLDVQKSWLRSPEEEYRASLAEYRADSGQAATYAMLWTAYRTNRLKEAIRYYARRDTGLAYGRDWVAWYTVAAAAMHALGRYSDELALAREARARRPDEYGLALVEARALLGMGRVREVEELITGSRALPELRAPGRLMHDIALELHAHGLRDDARRMFRRALAWHGAQLPGSPDEQMHRLNAALEHYYLGEYQPARKGFASLTTQYPDNRFYRTAAAYVAIRAGDSTQALRAIAELRADTVANDTYSARILTLLGRKDEAVAALVQFLNRGGRFILGDWHTVPELDGLRDYPPFRALVALKD